ncbi:MAG TPA: hypothetical protein VK530_09350, partial [Candidatus Acidoferrum sp.]|nr:hypothetical protein [Candidatus Acidoferrum sp.]
FEGFDDCFDFLHWCLGYGHVFRTAARHNSNSEKPVRTDKVVSNESPPVAVRGINGMSARFAAMFR